MRGVRFGLLAVIVLGLTSEIALGQQNQSLRDRDPDVDKAQQIAAEVQNATYHWGPFYLWGQIRLGDLGFGTEINAPTGDVANDVRLAIEAPLRTYFVPHKKVVFSAQLLPGYAFVGSGGQFDYSARGDMHLLLNHLYVDAWVDLTDKIRAHVSEIDRLATVRSSSYGVGGEYKHSSRTSVIFSVADSAVRYPQDRYQPLDRAVELLDRDEVVGRVAFHHKTFPLTSLFVALERGEYEFDRTTYKNSTRTVTTGGFLYDNGRTRLRAEAGPGKLEFDDPAQPQFDGILASFDVGRDFNRWSASLGGARDLNFAIFVDNNYYVATRGQVGLTRPVGRRWTVRLNGVRERDEFPVPVGGVRRVDDISFYSGGFTVNVWRFNLGSDLGWYERTSTSFGDEADGIRILIHLSFNL